MFFSEYKRPWGVREVREEPQRPDAGGGWRGVHPEERGEVLDVRDFAFAGRADFERVAVHGILGVLCAGLYVASRGGNEARKRE